jgi:hypothetical protein
LKYQRANGLKSHLKSYNWAIMQISHYLENESEILRTIRGNVKHPMYLKGAKVDSFEII